MLPGALYRRTSARPAPPVSNRNTSAAALRFALSRRPPSPCRAAALRSAYSAAGFRFLYSAAAMDKASAMEHGADGEAMDMAPSGRDLALP